MLIVGRETITRIEQLQQELDECLSFDLPVQHIQHEIDALSKRRGEAINVASSALICNKMFIICYDIQRYSIMARNLSKKIDRETFVLLLINLY